MSGCYGWVFLMVEWVFLAKWVGVFLVGSFTVWFFLVSIGSGCNPI